MQAKNLIATVALVFVVLFSAPAQADLEICGIIFPLNGFEGQTAATTEYSFISLGGSSIDLTETRIVVKNSASSSQFASALYHWSNLETFALSFDYSFSGTPADSWVTVSDKDGLVQETFSGSGGDFTHTFNPGDSVTLVVSAQGYSTATVDHIALDPPANPTHTPLPGSVYLLGAGLLGLGLQRGRSFLKVYLGQHP